MYLTRERVIDIYNALEKPESLNFLVNEWDQIQTKWKKRKDGIQFILHTLMD
jgi:hypothetical protein